MRPALRIAPPRAPRARCALRAPHGAAGAALLVAAALGASSVPAHAQRAVWLEAGVASVRYADSLSVTAASVGPAVRYETSRVAIGAVGTLSQTFADAGLGAWTANGAVGGSLFSGALGPLRGELVGNAGGSSHEDGTRTGQWRALARAHLMGLTRGVWAGGGAGQTWNGVAWRGVRAAELGGWARIGAAMVVATATPTSVDDGAGATVRYTDAELSLRWTGARAELGGTFGARAGDAADVAASGERTWGSVSALLRLVGPLGVVASVGTYPVDFTQGFPGGRFATLALRLTDDRPAAATAQRVSRERALRAAPPTVTDFSVETVPDGEPGARRIRVRAPHARAVALAGDFSSWEAVALAPAPDGWWEAVVALPPGSHQVSVRVDDGAWVAPPGLVVVTDEFGGMAGVLVIP